MSICFIEFFLKTSLIYFALFLLSCWQMELLRMERIIFEWKIIWKTCRFGGVLHEISLWICWLFSNYCFYLNEWGSIHFLWFSEHNSSFSIGTLFPITDSRVQFSKYRRNSNMVLLYLWQIHELFWAVQLWGCNRIIQVISSFIIRRIQRERIVFSYLLLKWSFCFE